MLCGGLIVGSGLASIIIGYATDTGGWLPDTHSMILAMLGLIAIPTGIIVFTMGAIINHRIKKSLNSAFPETACLNIQPSMIYNERMGITFKNAHTACPAYAPSRLSIMTGIQPSRSDVMQNTWYDGPRWREIPVLENIETIEQFFKNRGYKTLAGGKFYHTHAPPWLTIIQADPNNWDFYFPSAYIPIPYQIRAEENVIRPEYFRGKRLEWFTWGPIDISDQKMADYQVVDWAQYELDQKHDRPVYLACGIFRPHMPWEVLRKYFDMFPLEDIPDLVIQKNDLAYDRKYRKVIEEFRKELIQRVDREHVSMEDIKKDPAGYTVKDDKIIKISFIPMEELILEE